MASSSLHKHRRRPQHSQSCHSVRKNGGSVPRPAPVPFFADYGFFRSVLHENDGIQANIKTPRSVNVDERVALEMIGNCRTFLAVAKLLCAVDDESDAYDGNGDSKLYKHNFTASLKLKTAEFRQHAATHDTATVVEWVNFCVQFVGRAFEMTEGKFEALRQTPGPRRFACFVGLPVVHLDTATTQSYEKCSGTVAYRVLVFTPKTKTRYNTQLVLSFVALLSSIPVCYSTVTLFRVTPPQTHVCIFTPSRRRG